MDNIRKKELRNTFKRRTVVGGVCGIRCSGNGRLWIQASRDIESLRNRFNFALATGNAPDPSMLHEWREYGSASFSFEIFEELTRGENQTDREFLDDIDVLYEMWLDKTRCDNR